MERIFTQILQYYAVLSLKCVLMIIQIQRESKNKCYNNNYYYFNT